MKAVVIGAKGMLGTDLVTELEARGHGVVGLDLPDFDVTRADCIERLRKQDFGSYQWVFNCAAYTAVDAAEEDHAIAARLNGGAPHLLAWAVKFADARLMQISTDFVFDGLGAAPYKETDKPNPQSVYGKTKRMGELNAMLENEDSIIVRTAWLYGAAGKSFPLTMIKAWRAGKELRVVDDQIGCPTYTPDLARVLVDLAEKNVAKGIYHACGPEIMSWYDLALSVVTTYRDREHPHRPVEIARCKTEDWPTPAKRPPMSALNCEKIGELGIVPMRPVADALIDYVGRLKLDDTGKPPAPSSE